MAEVEKAAPLMMELGGTGLETSGGRVYEEFLHQLRNHLAPKVYREMSENDPVVGAILFAIEHLLRPVAWTVEAGSDAAEDVAAAEFLETIPEDMSHTWADFISEWMACPTYGFAPYEIVWKRRNGEKRSPGESSRFTDGKIGVRKLAIRHPDTLYRWDFDDEGGVQAMVQHAYPTMQAVTIPIEKLLLFRMMVRKGSPEGRSILRTAYTTWFRKKRVEAIEAIGIERDATGLPVLYYPSHWGIPGASAADAANFEYAKKLVRNLRNDEQMGTALPSIFDPDTKERLLKLELLATGGTRKIETNPVIERYSRQIAMTVLADVILLGHEKVGSFSLASSKTTLFTAGLGAMLDDIATTLNRHLVPRLLRLNGMTVTHPPQFRHGDVENIDLVELGDYISKLAVAGFPLFPTESGELERELLRAANLPDGELGRPIMPTLVPGADLELGVDADGAPLAAPDASEGVGGLATSPDARLNGAQITAALDVLQAVVTGELAEFPAVELLVGVGVPRDKAQQMVTRQAAEGVPPAEAAPAPVAVVPKPGKPPEKAA